jgi:hypothetical protein
MICFLDRSSFPLLRVSQYGLLLAFISGLHTSLNAQEAVADVHYAPSPINPPNPERGFFHYVDCNSGVDVATLQNYRNAGNTLVYCIVNLSSFINSPISQTQLDLFQRRMDEFRSAGLKAIPRFVYSENEGGADATPSRMQSHMDQVAPYLAKNKDVIAVVQAGFIGGWGEWAYSQNFGTIPVSNLSSQNWADRKTIVDKLLQIVPAERMIQVRTPRYKFQIVGSNVPLLASEAFNGSARARLGHHNDCFLASDNDQGTYMDQATEYPYLAAETLYLPMGGETCLYNPPRSDCPTAIAELSTFHWSYLNIEFNTDVLDKFKSQGCFDEIRQKLGYYFVLQQGIYSLNAKPGGMFAFNLTLQNFGWAAPFNARDVDLVLRNTVNGTLYRFKLDADPRNWLPGQAVTVSQTVTLPANITSGNYEVLLHLADPMASLRDRPEYAIQLANQDTWEAVTGFNRLHHVAGIAP